MNNTAQINTHINHWNSIGPPWHWSIISCKTQALFIIYWMTWQLVQTSERMQWSSVLCILPFHRRNLLVKWEPINLFAGTHFFRQGSISCTTLHLWAGLRTHYCLPSDSFTWGRRSAGKWGRQADRDRVSGEDLQTTEPLCQGFVNVFAIPWLKRSLSV